MNKTINYVVISCLLVFSFASPSFASDLSESMMTVQMKKQDLQELKLTLNLASQELKLLKSEASLLKNDVKRLKTELQDAKQSSMDIQTENDRLKSKYKTSLIVGLTIGCVLTVALASTAIVWSTQWAGYH